MLLRYKRKPVRKTYFVERERYQTWEILRRSDVYRSIRERE